MGFSQKFVRRFILHQASNGHIVSRVRESVIRGLKKIFYTKSNYNHMKSRCNRCQKEVEAFLTPKMVKFTHPLQGTDKRIPKWNVMVKSVCSECLRYIKFEKQDEKTMAELQESIDTAFYAMVKYGHEKISH
jgi:hypothetical protein